MTEQDLKGELFHHLYSEQQFDWWLGRVGKLMSRNPVFDVNERTYIEQSGPENYRSMFEDGLEPSEVIDEELYAMSVSQ